MAGSAERQTIGSASEALSRSSVAELARVRGLRFSETENGGREREGEAPAEPSSSLRLGRSLALPIRPAVSDTVLGHHPKSSDFSYGGWPLPRILFRAFFISLFLPLALGVPLSAAKLDEMSLDRWAKLREVERYQLQIAEKYYRDKDWKVALAEYEKYLTLYESSEAGSYAQLKWSLCQIQLRKSNTAIKEGFQSVIDYWPDSPEAVAAAYYIGQTYRDMGQLAKAKKAYQAVLQDHAKHPAAVRTLADLVDIATVENDADAKVELWKKLTFDAPRVGQGVQLCSEASRQLAAHYFAQAAFNDGVKALQTTYSDDQLPGEVAGRLRGPLDQLTNNPETKKAGEKLASTAIGFFRGKMPSNTSEPEAKNLARQYWFYIADIYAAARLATKVEETYAQIMRTFGSDDETLGRLAGWHKSLNKYDDARRTYRRFRDKSEGLNQVAKSYREENNGESAIAIYRELVGRDPDNKVRWTSEIGATYHSARQFDKAVDAYRELLTLDPEHSETWRWKVATAYREGRKFKEAINWYRQCTNFPSNYREMASCHRSLKQYREALTLYAQVAGGDPKSAPWAMWEMARTQEMAGNKEKAIQAFQQVCKRFPTDSHASLAHEHLQSKYQISITLGGAKDE
jgi:tetratricopeptide (TPR) repeat protein